MNYRAHDNRRTGMVDIIIIILVLINSGYALTTGKTTLLLLLLIALMVALLYKKRFCLHVPRKDSKLVVIGLMAVSMVLSFLANWDIGAVKVYFHTALFILNGYVFRLVYTGRQVVNAFIKVLLIGAIASIVIAIVDTVIPIAAFAPRVVNGAEKEYYTLGLVNYQAETYFRGKRSCGLFWEPGMFSGMLTLAAMMDIYTRRDEWQIWRIVTYCVAIFITFSTAGYVYFIMIGLLLAVRNKSSGRSAMVLIILGIAVIFFSSMIQDMISRLFELLPLVFDKVKTQNLSYRTRLTSPVADFLLMIKHPFGTGFSDVSVIRTAMMKQLGAKTSITTSTLTYFGVSSGVMFFIAYNFSWISNFLSGKQGGAIKLFSIMIFGLVLTSNPMFNNQFIWIVLFMSFSGVQENAKSMIKSSAPESETE